MRIGISFDRGARALECGDLSPPFPLTTRCQRAARQVALSESADKSTHSKMRAVAVTFILLSFLTLHAAEWVNISEAVTSKVKPGYAGPTAGVVADPASGDVFMVVNDQGLWKSSDQGANFTRVDGTNVGGRCETGWALNIDPDGRRLFCFMIYGSSAMTLDGGKS